MLPQPSKVPVVRLMTVPAPGTADAPLLLARSAALIAAIELPWINALQRGADTATDGLPAANVMTLIEVRDAPAEIAGLDLMSGIQASAPSKATAAKGPVAECVGLWLRVRDRSAPGGAASNASVTPSLQRLDIHKVVKEATKARALKAGPDASGTKWTDSGSDAPSPDREEYLKHLSRKVIVPDPLFGTIETKAPFQASDVAEAIAEVQHSQLADLTARQLTLHHFAKQAPARAAHIAAKAEEQLEISNELRSAAKASKEKVETVQKKQKELQDEHSALVKALKVELDLRRLDETVATQLPRLWSHLHELRQTFELFRAASTPEAPGVHAVFGNKKVATVEELQRVWTDFTSDSLLKQVQEIEQAMALGTSTSPHTPGSHPGV